MIISIHQPNYIPHPGFFDKISKSDVFVLFDDVQYTKGGYQNRVRITEPIRNNPIWLTVPVQNASFKLTEDILISYDMKWIDSHVSKISKLNVADHNKLLIDKICSHVSRKHKYLVDLNVPIINFFVEHFKFNSKILMSSDICMSNKSRNATEKIIDICMKLGASKYLSGLSGHSYIDFNLFELNNIKLKFQDDSDQILKKLELNAIGDSGKMPYSVIQYL
jgi:hypothetical protein